MFLQKKILPFGRFLKMKFFQFIFIFFVLHLFLQKAGAQPYFFTNYNVDNGLSNNTVRCISKDSDGYIWIGTEAGLNRFNGYDFNVYKSVAGDSTTLISNSIRCLLTDHSGNLWVGTGKGICRYVKKTNTFERIYVRAGSDRDNATDEMFIMLEDSKKNIWAGYSTFGLTKYDEKRNCFESVIGKMPVLSNNMVDGITEDKNGTLWLSSYSELLNYNPVTKTIREYRNSLSSDNSEFQALKVYEDLDDSNYLWISTWGNGIVHFNKHTAEFISYKFHLNGAKNLHNIVFDIHHHEKNKLWLATSEGIVRFDAGNKLFTGYVHDSINTEPVVNSEIHSFYQDNENILWIGSVNGLSNIHPTKQYFVGNPLWLHAPVNDFYYDAVIDKLYGTHVYSDRSLVIYDRKTNKENKYKIPLADELGAEPFSVVKDNNGLIWIGTTKGIYTFNELQNKFSLFKIGRQLHIPDRSVYVRQVVKDSQGNLWFACFSKGILMVNANTKEVTSYLHNDNDSSSFPFYAISGIAAGRGKTIYVSDDRLGIVEFDYGQNRTFHFSTKEKKYAALYDAADLAVDKSGRIWITTRNNGLVCIDKNHEAVAYIKDDFGNIIDEQNNVVIDDSEKVWFNANNGIYCFNPVVKSFTQFTLQDGLPPRSFLLNRMDNGNIAIKISEGIFCFDPLKISKTNNRLNVHLTGLFINGKLSEFSNTIDRMDTVSLMHSENNLTIEFAATDFAYPSSTLYSYKLEGIDNNWSVPAKTRTLNFSQLSPGNFLLHIRAGNNSSEKNLFICIIPAWWQTAWFKWLVVLSCVTSLFFSIRFFLSLRYKQQIATLQQQREIENIRMRISRDIHDEIGSGLTKIKLMSRHLSKVKEANAMMETTARISNASDELIQNLGEIVWTINPANDTLENVFAFTRNYASKLFDENSEIKSTLDFAEPSQIPKNILINPEVKRNLLLILKEALTNIFKHSEASEVRISLAADKSAIEMQIHDNGKGMPEGSQNNFGNGLKNMRKRAESIHAEFNIHSTEKSGTSVYIVIPLKEI
jgi:ligand-binding sensor domain-containing protein/signal transduction histidine kinase